MKRDDILNSYWLSYLKWWKANVSNPTKPPSENDFWAWYATEKLSDNNDTRINIDDIAD